MLLKAISFGSSDIFVTDLNDTSIDSIILIFFLVPFGRLVFLSWDTKGTFAATKHARCLAVDLARWEERRSLFIRDISSTQWYRRDGDHFELLRN